MLPCFHSSLFHFANSAQRRGGRGAVTIQVGNGLWPGWVGPGRKKCPWRWPLILALITSYQQKGSGRCAMDTWIGRCYHIFQESQTTANVGRDNGAALWKSLWSRSQGQAAWSRPGGLATQTGCKSLPYTSSCSNILCQSWGGQIPPRGKQRGMMSADADIEQGVPPVGAGGPLCADNALYVKTCKTFVKPSPRRRPDDHRQNSLVNYKLQLLSTFVFLTGFLSFCILYYTTLSRI